MIDKVILIVIINRMITSMNAADRRGRGRPRKRAGELSAADQLRRLQFIERSAIWTGQVGRRAVAAAFDVSVSNVTLDFQRYREIAPRNLTYDVTERCFRPTDKFEPIFADETASMVLATIGATALLPDQDRGRLLGFLPPVDTVKSFPAAIEKDTLALVCRAITSGKGVVIDYQSMSTPNSVKRDFWPRALILTGHRWLVRGWDERHADYRDFALARILSSNFINQIRELPRDKNWHDRARIIVGLADDLSEGQKLVTAREFGMTQREGRMLVEIDSRQAMIPYVLDHLRVRAAEQLGENLPIKLLNYGEIRQFDRPQK
jgi:predicted DNA-binding transcriptional regulator YafY